jgi:ribose/xylose/arabinose/galactoside ABC-type transport system permease subunit
MAAALGGMLVAARISSAQTNAGTGLELSVIAAVVIGGTSLFGGTGSVFGTVLGTLLISVIANGMVLTEVNPFYQEIVIGAIIVIAVAIDGLRRRRLAER